MKFAYTILYVSNVEQTLAFYIKAFGFEQKMITPEKDYGELNTGETTLSVASHALGEQNFNKPYQKTAEDKPPFGIELAFTSLQIEKDFKRAIDAGATVFEPLDQKPWGQIVGYLRDINGYLIEVCTPMGD